MNEIFKFKGDVPPVKELQRLFAKLKLSDRCAVDTHDLLDSLKWGIDFFETKDVEVWRPLEIRNIFLKSYRSGCSITAFPSHKRRCYGISP